MPDWLIALISAVIAGGCTHWFSRRADREKLRDAAREDSYASLLRAVADSAYAQDEIQRTGARREYSAAKARIAVYGSASVVRAIARFEECEANIRSESGRLAFLEIAVAMRDKSGSVETRAIERLLLGSGRTA